MPDKGVIRAFLAQKRQSLLAVRQSLPIYPFREEIIKEISLNDHIIVVGETGSGKTTQVPQFLYEDGRYTKIKKTPEGKQERSMIAVVQPRRVAATSIARRVADEMGVILGEEVGYAVRFDERSRSEHSFVSSRSNTRDLAAGQQH